MLQLFDECNHIADLKRGEEFTASTTKMHKIMDNGNVLRTWTPIENEDSNMALPAYALPRTSRCSRTAAAQKMDPSEERKLLNFS